MGASYSRRRGAGSAADRKCLLVVVRGAGGGRGRRASEEARLLQREERLGLERHPSGEMRWSGMCRQRKARQVDAEVVQEPEPASRHMVALNQPIGQ